MLYEMTYPNHLAVRIGEITSAYFAAVTAAGPGEDPLLVERYDTYDGMDKVVCKVIQYLAMKLSYVKKCRSYAEYERWQKEETDGMWPMVLGQAWLAPVYHMLPHEEQLKIELDRLEPPKQEVKKEGYRNEDEEDGRRATRLLDIPREEDTSPAETLVMLKTSAAACCGTTSWPTRS